jgi:hypothetical protein
MNRTTSKMTSLTLWACVAILFIAGIHISAPACFAQLANAQISGSVHDSSGALIPGARLALKNQATGVTTVSTTNGDGVYVIQQILPGTYTLEASMAGFRTTRLEPFQLVVNQATVFDMTLAVGATDASVTVQAVGSEVESASAELGTVLTSEQIEDLPTGRNVQNLMHLTPGVSEIQTGQSPIPSVDGQINRTSIFLLDGISDTAYVYSSMALVPLPEMIDQFKVESHNDSAQLGGVLGGIINQTSKAGTNNFHGEAWEIEQNSAFNARNYFSLPGRISPFKDHNAGGVVGGPVRIPKLYNGRDKTFFFFGYQYERSSAESQSFYRVPTAQEEENGDFSDYGNPIFNPFSTTLNADGSYSRQPFPGNKIPANLMNPGTVYFAKTLLPAPVNVGFGGYNAVATNPAVSKTQTVSVRIDHKFSDSDTVFGRFSGTYNPQTSFYDISAEDYNYTANVDTTAFGWVHTFGSKATLQVQYGSLVYYSDDGARFHSLPSNFAATVGYSSSFLTPYLNGQSYLPGFDVPGFFNSGEYYEHNQPANDLHWRANYSRLMGNHLLTAGGEYNKLGYTYRIGQSYTGFSTTQTADPQNYGSTGDSLASFFLNVPDNASRRDSIESIPASAGETGFFLQDSWKAMNKLVINLGLRWDYADLPSAGTPADNNNKMGDMDYIGGNYILQSLAPPCATALKPPCIPTPNGVLPAHVIVSPTGKILQNTPYNFQPRIGLAYRTDDKTVIRAAGGMFFDDFAGTTQLARNPIGTWPSLGYQAVANLNYPTTTALTPTTSGTNPLPSAILPGLSPFSQGDDWFFDPRWKNPYSYQYNVGVQRQLSGNFLATLNYAGSISRRTDVGGRYNVAPSPGPGDPVLRYPFPYMPIPFDFDRSVGHSSYNALEASLERRYSNGLALTASYTYSKSLDLGSSGMFSIEGFSVENPYNLRPDWGPSSFDIRHNLVISWVYELPFGTGQRFATGSHVANYILGNWKWNGVGDFRSGVPVNPTVNADIANTGDFGYERPDLVGDFHIRNPSKTEWFNTAAFASPALYTFGDSGRDILRSQFVHQFNMSLFRQFPIHEGISADFRVEAYNVFNTVTYNAPDAEMTDTTFGQISSALPSRSVHIGAYVHF